MSLIKMILLSGLVFSTIYSNAKEESCPVDWRMGANRVPKESLATETQFIRFAKFIRESIVLNDQPIGEEDIVAGLNLILKTEGLPVIQQDNDYKFEYVSYNSFRNSQRYGVDIRNSDFAYCFPCKSGYNNTLIGIFPRGVQVDASQEGLGICEYWEKKISP